MPTPKSLSSSAQSSPGPTPRPKSSSTKTPAKPSKSPPSRPARPAAPSARTTPYLLLTQDNSLDGRDPLKTHYSSKELGFRRALPAYEYLRSLENQALAAGKAKENLKVYVLCAGIVYGNGEDALFDLVDTAYQGERPLTMIGDGKNKIPMIHCVDLSSIVKFLVHERPADQDYIHAIDFAPNRTQGRLLSSISEALGGQEVLQQTHLDSIFNEDYNTLTLNLNLVPTDLLTSEDSKSDKDAYRQTYAEGEKKTYRWKYRSGFAENFDAIYNEYKSFRNLKTIKLAVVGPKLSQGSIYGEDIAKKLRIPFILYDSLIREVLARDDALGKEVREFLDNEKSRMVREATEELEKLKAKKKKGIPDAINPDDYEPKLSLQIVNKIFSWRLGKSDCKNKGYVLENYPSTREEAAELFVEKIPVKNEVVDTLDAENSAGSAAGKPGTPPPPLQFQLRLRKEIMPDKVVAFSAESAAEVLGHLRSTVGEDRFADYQVIPEEVEKSFAEWAAKQSPETSSVGDFYREQKVEIIPVALKSFETSEKVLEHIGEKIDFGLRDAAAEEEKSFDATLGQSMVERPAEEREPAAPEEAEQQNSASLEEIKQQEQEILNQKSQALKQYITDNLLPVLTSGLIDICSSKPEDPLDYLADYLIAMSQKKSTAPKDEGR